MKQNTPEALANTLPIPQPDGSTVERTQLSLTEASKVTGVPVSQFRRLCRQGVLNPITGFGRKWYLSASDILALQARRLRNATEE